MHRLISMYNRNRFKIWIIIFIIIFVISIIHVLNNAEKQRSIEEQNEIDNNDISNVTNSDEEEKDYKKESNTLTEEDEEVPDKYKTKFGNVIDKFYTACVKGDMDTAYNLLSDECKNMMYPNQTLFENLYCKEKFNGNKEYSFQSWKTSGNKYMYQVKIFDNMLATGKSSKDGYIEDYVTLVPYEDSFKLNVNGYIGTVQMDEKSDDDILTIQVKSRIVYKDYEIYKYEIKNNTQDTVLVDTGKKTNTMYLVDNLENKFLAFSYEKSKSDLTIEPGKTKNIEIKYDRAFDDNTGITKIIFSNIVKYNEYMENQSIDGETMEIKIEEDNEE